jgi:MshEN domain
MGFLGVSGILVAFFRGLESAKDGVSVDGGWENRMAKRFGSYLIEEKLVTEEQLAQALERQVTVGGRLGTNLVELGFLNDQQLAQALGRHLQMDSAASSAFDEIPNDVIQQFPKDLAQRHAAIAFRKEGRALCIAMTDPTELTALDDIKFVVGCAVKTYLAPETKIQYALEKYYGVERPIRYVVMESPSDHHSFDGNGVVELIDPEETVPALANFMQALKSASEELLRVKHRDAIVSVLLRECARVADQALFFAVVEGRAIVSMGRGGRYAPERFLGLDVRLEESPMLSQVVEKEEPITRDLTAEIAGATLSDLLVDARARQFIVFPLLAGGGHAGRHDAGQGRKPRVVGILYADMRKTADGFHYGEQLYRLVAKAGMAMDMLIMQKKILEL